jgi:hypothetical protein
MCITVPAPLIYSRFAITRNGSIYQVFCELFTAFCYVLFVPDAVFCCGMSRAAVTLIERTGLPLEPHLIYKLLVMLCDQFY